MLDDLASVDAWRPRGVEIRGRAEATTLADPLIRIHPRRIVKAGLGVARSARTVARQPALSVSCSSPQPADLRPRSRPSKGQARHHVQIPNDDPLLRCANSFAQRWTSRLVV